MADDAPQFAQTNLQNHSDSETLRIIAQRNSVRRHGQPVTTAANAFVDGSTYLTPANVMQMMTLTDRLGAHQNLIDIRVRFSSLFR
jgi:hypothetical protein